MKKLLRLTALLLIFCTLVLCGCTQPLPNEVTYSVRVINAAGEPYTTGVIVQILKDAVPATTAATEESTEAIDAESDEEEEETEPTEADPLANKEQVAMKPVGTDGKITVTLPRGEYTVALKFTDEQAEYFYDKTNLTLTADNPDLEIYLYSQTVYDNTGAKGALDVKAGDVTVRLIPGQRNYFLFTAQSAGVYQFTTSDPKATVGYYGYTSYIMEKSVAAVENNTMEISITASMVGESGTTAQYVIGVDADGITECTLKIERIADPEYSIEENEPWVIYKPKAELKKFTTPKGTIKQFDLTASTDAYKIVFNENDQTYHLGTAEGPQILVQLSKPTTYLPSIAEICTTTGVKKYFYDADGKFVKREDYTECLQIYSKNKESAEGDRGQNAGTEIYLDAATGLYPLTEDLKYIIQNHGEYAGWWDDTNPGFLFQDADGNHLVGLNPDIAWLFLCCYVET